MAKKFTAGIMKKGKLPKFKKVDMKARERDLKWMRREVEEINFVLDNYEHNIIGLNPKSFKELTSTMTELNWKFMDLV